MEKSVKGDVVVLPFPFSDLSDSKRRPALVVADLEGDDVILCQITSESRVDNYSIILMKNDFEQGNLGLTSLIRPNRLFTADKYILLYKAGSLKNKKIKEIEEELVKLFKN